MNKKPIMNLSQYAEAVSKAGNKPPKEDYFTHGGVCPACGNKSLQDGLKYIRCGYVECPYFETKPENPPWEHNHNGTSITQLMPEHIRENPRPLRIVGICGEPGTGKTTLMRKIIACIDRKAEEDWEEFKHGTLYYRKKRSFIVFGSYVGEPFDGTDKLSMAVVNDAEDFIDKMSGNRAQILFEGDRLFCERFINFCRQRAETLFYRLTVGADVMFQRQAVRELKGIKQTASFIQGRRTKYDNLCSRFTSIIKMPNSNTIEAAKILNNIYQFLGG